MKIDTINSRELSKSTSRILKNLPQSGPQLITRSGKVMGILMPPTGEGIEADIDLASRLRFGQALASTQRHSIQNQTTDLSIDEIDNEILQARTTRAKKTSP